MCRKRVACSLQKLCKLLWLKAQAIFAGRLAEVLGAVAAEVGERGEIHHVGYLGEREGREQW